jgi:hypothetical protein
VEDEVRCELVKLHTINKKKLTKELVGRERESAEEEGEEHHPIAAQGLGDRFGARELDGVTAGYETIRLGLLQLLLHEGRGTQLVTEFVAFPLAILFFAARCFTRIYESVLGGYA